MGQGPLKAVLNYYESSIGCFQEMVFLGGGLLAEIVLNKGVAV